MVKMKFLLRVVLGAIGIYAVALAISWHAGNYFAERNAHELLNKAKNTFQQVIDEAVKSMMTYACCLAVDRVRHDEAHAISNDKLASVAKELYLSEANIIDTNGIVIASSSPKLVGSDMHTHSATREFLRLFDPAYTNMVMYQKFRVGVHNPETFSAYAACNLYDYSGLIEIGYPFENLVLALRMTEARTYRSVKFGHYGHFDALDLDKDGIPDPADYRVLRRYGIKKGFSIVERDGEKAYQMTFSYSGRVFMAIVPEREFGEQRNQTFIFIAASLAVLIAFFSTMLALLKRSSDKVEALHRVEEARSAADLSLARTIQMSCLPNVEYFAPDEVSFSLCSLANPAREIGGDIYDCFRTADGRVAIIVADVAGKGVPAAMFMLVAKNALENILRVSTDLGEAMAQVNNYLCENNEAQMFLTVWLGLLNTTTGVIDYVNAGHCRPYVIKADGEIICLRHRGGRLVGMFSDISYTYSSYEFKPGDRLFLYTDGVTEAMNAGSVAYGEERLLKMLSGRHENLLADIYADVKRHAGDSEQSDDITMMTMTWLGEPERHEREFKAEFDSLAATLQFLTQTIKLKNKPRIARMLNAVDELAANVVSYSKATTYTVVVENSVGRCLVTLIDDGIEYNPFANATHDRHQTLEQRKVGGLGIVMARRLVDFAAWRRRNNQNVVSLVIFEMVKV